MAFGEAKSTISRKAAVDLTAKQHHFVTLAGAVPAAGALAFPNENDDAHPDREPAVLVIGGVAPIYYGAAVAEGQALTTDDEGKAVPAEAGNAILGYALEAGASGELGTILVHPNGVQA